MDNGAHLRVSDCGTHHVDDDGRPAYARRFVRVFGFYEGRAAVAARDGWFHITPEGWEAYEARHAWCGNFQEGRCTVREKDGTYRHIDPRGVPVYPERWRYAGDFSEGFAVVQAGDGHSTHIDAEGKFVHDRRFPDLDVFHKGYARARDGDGWMHIDGSGAPIYERRFQTVEPFYNGQARVERFDGALEVIDETGVATTTLRPPRRSELAALSEDLVGFWRTQTLGAAVRLGVFEALPDSEAAIAERCGLTPEGTQRLLRSLGELAVVTRYMGRWELTARGVLLQKDHHLTLADAALEYAGPFARMWETLPDALRSNSGWKPPDIFADVAKDSERCAGHHRMLRSYARHDYAQVASALDLQGTECVVDAGGGVGVLAQRLVDAYPQLEVTVLDRPEVVAMGEASGPRVHWHGADLFDVWGVRGDAVILARVLHDWDDSDAIRILKQARTALPRGGKVYLVEMLLEEGGLAGGLCDLHLLMATGGRERSLGQYGRLLEEAGFIQSAARRLSSLSSIVEGVAQ
ncbi:methyltransferase [Thioalkalivibrio sp. ALE19]|uniref:methyltransferase n=1 Tax=Thioalkalivibrio sp. ALE19 TaxID=1266909 RepID=UPI0004067889|nr:methyltransferase [Thioalkalivibrio sp. ALE19]